MGRISKLNPS